MNHHRPPPQARWKQHVPGLSLSPEKEFHWRSREVSRIEGFTDAVFAFAVTLLIVALEVPHTYAGFVEMLKGFPAFVAGFALLMTFWNSHYRYFRRYGLEDGFTRFVTYAILLLVLFSVYPVKFLFSAWLGGHHGADRPIQTIEQFQTISRFFGLGLTAIWSLFASLYAHALRRQAALRLNAVEIILTRQAFFGCALNVGIAVVAVGFSYAAEPSTIAMSAGIYLLVPVGLLLNRWWHRRQVRLLPAPAAGHRG